MLNKWTYINNPNWGYVYSKCTVVYVNEEKYLQQIILSNDKMNNGVYLLTKYHFETLYNIKKEKNIFHLELKSFDQLLSPLDEEFEKKLQGLNLVTIDEIKRYKKEQTTEEPRDIPELVISYR